MRHPLLQPAAGGDWQQARQRWQHIRKRRGNASNPYSPVFSIGLLLIVALAFNIGH
jgi:hypothetical protein